MPSDNRVTAKVSFATTTRKKVRRKDHHSGFFRTFLGSDRLIFSTFQVNSFVTIQLGFKLSKIGVIAGTRCVSTASFDPVYEGKAKFIGIFSDFMGQR
ncbi:hypothetical protein KAI46_13980 [bacterium]|nr:hypothetical protein [bacterium]